MGLDSTELVLEIEDTFQIQIPDDEYAGLATVGQLHDYIVERTQQPLDVWETLREVICRQLHVSPEEVQYSTRFIEDLRMD